MSEQHKNKKASILFVDDEELAIMTLRRIFQQDFTIYTALNGAEALKLVRAHPEITVLVTDLRMPKMDGIELARQVAQESPTIVSILLTAYADITLIVDTMREGILHQYMAKPYDDRILKQEVIRGIQWNTLLKERDSCNIERIELKKEIAKIKNTQ